MVLDEVSLNLELVKQARKKRIWTIIPETIKILTTVRMLAGSCEPFKTMLYIHNETSESNAP